MDLNAGVNRKKVCAFVYNNCKNDARVLKEAKTLVDTGYDVTIFAVKDSETEWEEIRNGFKIIRIDKNPFHFRMFKNISRFRGLPKRPLFRFKKAIYRTWYAVAYRKRAGNKKPAYSNKLALVKKLKHYRRVLLSKGMSSTAQELFNDNPLIFICIGWLVLIFAFLLLWFYRFIKIIFLFCYKGIIWFFNLIFLRFRLFMMVFHKQFCYYDFYKRCKEKINVNEVDVLHCHDLNTLFTGVRLKKRAKCILVYDSHELYVERNRQEQPSKLKLAILKYIEKKFIRQCDAVITVGECIANELEKRYKISTPTVIMNAPSLKNKDQFHLKKSLRQILNISSEYKLMIYAGGITFNRGLDKLIKSLQLLPDCYLVLLGYGREDFIYQLQEIANECSVSGRFSIYGPVPPHEVSAYVSSADLGVAPIENVCLSYYYCAPNKVFEYLLGGIPVIASNFPELTKIVEKYHVGYTFNPDDPESISEAVKRIFSNREEYLSMKKNTMDAAENYNWEIESGKLVGLYKNII